MMSARWAIATGMRLAENGTIGLPSTVTSEPWMLPRSIVKLLDAAALMMRR